MALLIVLMIAAAFGSDVMLLSKIGVIVSVAATPGSDTALAEPGAGSQAGRVPSGGIVAPATRASSAPSIPAGTMPAFTNEFNCGCVTPPATPVAVSCARTIDTAMVAATATIAANLMFTAA